MKHYLFAGHFYYPEGGVNDLVGCFETKAEAKAKLAVMLSEMGEFTRPEWAEIMCECGRKTDTWHVGDEEWEAIK